MVTLMNEQELTTLEQVRCFLDGTEPVAAEEQRAAEGRTSMS